MDNISLIPRPPLLKQGEPGNEARAILHVILNQLWLVFTIGGTIVKVKITIR